MIPSVHILATCRDMDLLGGTLLVFDTLRTGFPGSKIFVWGNKLPVCAYDRVKVACREVKATFTPLPAPIQHDAWIERLLNEAPEQFWVCDTDIVFWDSVETFPDCRDLLAGRFEPAFVEPWTGTHKAARLHTSLLWFDALAIRQAIRAWYGKWTPKGFPFLPQTEFVRQSFIPQGPNRPPIFYDTCAGLYQAIGGSPFLESENSAFEHLHCGVYADRISRSLPGLLDKHREIYANREAAKGLQQQQAEFYKQNALPD